MKAAFKGKTATAFQESIGRYLDSASKSFKSPDNDQFIFTRVFIMDLLQLPQMKGEALKLLVYL